MFKAIRTLSLLLGLTTGHAEALKAEHAGDVIPQLRIYIQKQMKDKSIPALSIALVEGRDVLWTEGFRNPSPLFTAQPEVDADTLFEIGSISKTMTAMMIMQMLEKGKLGPEGLDTPLHVFLKPQPGKAHFEMKGLPTQPKAHETITLRSLLNHHSGIPGDMANRVFTTHSVSDYNQHLLRSLHDHVMTRPINHSFAYSNTAYCLLGEVIDRHSGTGFKDYSRAFFHAMGMTDASFLYEDLAHPKRCAMGFDAQNKSAKLLHNNMLAAGSVRASAWDMAKYLKTLLALSQGETVSGDILSPATFQKMIATDAAKAPMDGHYLHGLGFYLRDNTQIHEQNPLELLFHHDGVTPHFESKMLLAKDAGFGVYVGINKTGVNPSEIASHVLQEIVKAKGKLDNVAKAPLCDSEPLNPQLLTGCYLNSLGAPVYKIAFQGAALTLAVGEFASNGAVQFQARPFSMTLVEKNIYDIKDAQTGQVLAKHQFRKGKAGEMLMDILGCNEPNLCLRLPEQSPDLELTALWEKYAGTSWIASNFDPVANYPFKKPETVVVMSSIDGHKMPLLGCTYGNDYYYCPLIPISRTHAMVFGLGRRQGGWIWFETSPDGKEILHHTDLVFTPVEGRSGLIPSKSRGPLRVSGS